MVPHLNRALDSSPNTNIIDHEHVHTNKHVVSLPLYSRPIHLERRTPQSFTLKQTPLTLRVHAFGVLYPCPKAGYQRMQKAEFGD